MMALFWIEEGVVLVLVITGGVVGVVVTDWVSWVYSQPAP